MKPGQSVTFAQLNSAFADVQRELARVGLWQHGSPLLMTDVVWCTLPPHDDIADANGFFMNGSHRRYVQFGFEPGHIYIPRRIPSQGPQQDRGSLRDVLRHEFGHAVAYHYRRLVRNKKFSITFGAPYYAEWLIHPSDPADFVSDYAMSSPMEDFAETFAHWLCNPTNPIYRLPRFRNGEQASRGLLAKLAFVRQLCRTIARL
jgi:hypothetical protein